MARAGPTIHQRIHYPAPLVTFHTQHTPEIGVSDLLHQKTYKHLFTYAKGKEDDPQTRALRAPA